ncbi:MAG: hypothetical protein UV78_C0078G0005 [Parcubacteria group bacterium GW2011_GWA2_43_17]|nr:MAG: hypothetical protein UV78_C0078G0005 [Parcubacteria group bacterium GW2011_GWA2_43_17]KKT92143.1 MAG: hypothetical protein UW91_C0026G0027 [Parcubacteria group bacterium GW2011_GWF2_45_11]KKT96358.1 MAG: hypothetical protein UW98_C0046G0004 [Parcubacteria group bacterium GW2011_GWC2_45_15]
MARVELEKLLRVDGGLNVIKAQPDDGIGLT